jgi:hypothetical protein
MLGEIIFCDNVSELQLEYHFDLHLISGNVFLSRVLKESKHSLTLKELSGNLNVPFSFLNISIEAFDICDGSLRPTITD